MSTLNFVNRPRCDLCGCGGGEILAAKEFKDPAVWSFICDYYEKRIAAEELGTALYEVLVCRECGLIWQAYILDDRSMGYFYDNIIPSTRSLRKKKNAPLSLYSGYAREAEAVSLMLSKSPYEIDVLDFGMGWGYWCMMARAFGYNVLGFEFSPSRIEYAKAMGVPTIDDLNEISAYQFDYINSFQVFEHLSHPRDTLNILVSCLKPGGILYISVPNGHKIRRKFRNTYWQAEKDAIQPLEHINCFTHATLVRMGKAAGLSLLKSMDLPTMRFVAKGQFRNLFKTSNGSYFGTSLFFKKPSSGSASQARQNINK